MTKRHMPASAVALFFDEVRFEQANKTSWMGNYAGGLTLLDPINAPVDRIAIVVLIHWAFGTEPERFSVLIQTPFGEIEERAEVQRDLEKFPENPSPFAGIRALLPMNLRLQPLAPGMTIDAWLVVGGTQDLKEERYPLGRLVVSAQPSQPIKATLPTSSRRKKKGSTPAEPPRLDVATP